MKTIRNTALIFTLCAFLLCCGNDNSSDPQESINDFHVRVLSNENITLDNNVNTVLLLYGFNNNEEHISAEPIMSMAEAQSTVQQLPIELDVELNGDEESLVCQNLNPCQAMYYFHVLIDLDGDGQICPGDLVPDYNTAPKQYYSMEELTAQEHEVYVKTKTGLPSDCVSPSEYYQKMEGLYKVPVGLVVDDDIEFDPNVAARVILYGFDDDLVEPSLVPIVATTMYPDVPTEQPIEFDIPLTEDPAPYICKDNYTCSARYAFEVKIDVDGDGRICPGDLIQDYDLSSLESYTLDELTTLENEVHLRVKEGDPSECSDLTETEFF